MRLLITGGPRTGKSTLAQQLALEMSTPHCSTDELLDDTGLSWHATITQVVKWMEQPEPWLIEGVKIPHAMACWAELHPKTPPADRVIFLTKPLVLLTGKQLAMMKGIYSVWRGVSRLVPVVEYRQADWQEELRGGEVAC